MDTSTICSTLTGTFGNHLLSLNPATVLSELGTVFNATSCCISKHFETPDYVSELRQLPVDRSILYDSDRSVSFPTLTLSTDRNVQSQGSESHNGSSSTLTSPLPNIPASASSLPSFYPDLSTSSTSHKPSFHPTGTNDSSIAKLDQTATSIDPSTDASAATMTKTHRYRFKLSKVKAESRKVGHGVKDVAEVSAILLPIAFHALWLAGAASAGA